MSGRACQRRQESITGLSAPQAEWGGGREHATGHEAALKGSAGTTKRDEEERHGGYEYYRGRERGGGSRTPNNTLGGPLSQGDLPSLHIPLGILEDWF